MEVRRLLVLLLCLHHCSRVLHAQDQALCLCKSLSSKYPQVVCPHYRLQHAPCRSPSTEQFIASLLPNRASANFIRMMDYVRKHISPIDSLFQRTHYLSHFL